MIKLKGCSLGCAYAEGNTVPCECECGGAMHGMLVVRPVAAKCSPAAEGRCKSGEEDGDCSCACGGENHAIYRHIESFENVRVIGMVTK